MQDITPTLKVGSNQHISKEKFSVKFFRGVKVAIAMILILTAAGGIIYAKTTKYVAEKEKEILNAKLITVQGELDTLKGQK